MVITIFIVPTAVCRCKQVIVGINEFYYDLHYFLYDFHSEQKIYLYYKKGDALRRRMEAFKDIKLSSEAITRLK